MSDIATVTKGEGVCKGSIEVLSHIGLVTASTVHPSLDPLIYTINYERRADRDAFIHPFNSLCSHQSDYCGLFAGACWSCLLSRVRVGGEMEVYVCVFSAGGGTELRSLFLSQTDRSRGSAHIQSRVSAVRAQTSIISTCWFLPNMYTARRKLNQTICSSNDTHAAVCEFLNLFLPNPSRFWAVFG